MSEINMERNTAKLTMIGARHVTLSVGCDTLGFLDEQDASQTAVRIVRLTCPPKSSPAEM
jgi:hypothetical protein